MPAFHCLVLPMKSSTSSNAEGQANTAKRDSPILTGLFPPNPMLVFFRKFCDIFKVIRSLRQKSCAPEKVLLVFEAIVGTELISQIEQFSL